jgi:hypothetical protein
MTKRPTNTDDVIDSRDILNYIEEHSETYEEVQDLQKIINQYCDEYKEGLEDLRFGVFFIRDYMWDYFFEVNEIDEALGCYIDIEAFARDQQYFYSSIDFDGEQYWYQQC